MAWRTRPCYRGDLLLCTGVLPPVVKRPVYEADDEPAMRCYPALCRERCVQRSLPCVGRVDREVEAPVSPAREAVLIPLKPWLQKRLRDGLTAVEIT